MPRQILYNGIVFPYKTVASTLSQTIDLRGMGDSFSLQVDFQDVTTAYKDFQNTAVNTSTNNVAITAHGQVVGSLGQLTSTGALPSGLSLATNYYIIVVDANTIAFASSLANAVAGTKIVLGTQGTGRHTFTPTVSSANTIVGRVSNDGISFMNVNNLLLITNSASVTVASGTASTAVWDFGMLNCKYLNVLYTPTAGTSKFQVTMNTWVRV